jgi:hypothetical protein
MKKTILIFGISSFLLIVVELFSYLIISNEKPKGLTFTKIDPLLGWATSEEDANELNYKLEKNTIVLSYQENNCDSFLTIYISGGSTSDLMYDNNNWPLFLFESLKKEGICVKVYVAATSGYSTGQEYLKLIRDYNEILPDIHISYNGANESEYPSYVSLYEIQFYNENIFFNYLMPNFFKLLLRKNLIKIEGNYLYNKMFEAHDFWIKNNLLMKNHADLYNYKFYSILQPVRGYSGQKMDKKTDRYKNEYFFHNIIQFTNFYPKAINTASEHNFITDLTKVFENIDEEVFHDDCHLKSYFQEGVAEKILLKINS